jgi:hypothetical protein
MSLISSVGRATRRRTETRERRDAAMREGRVAAAAFSDAAHQGDGPGEGGVTSASVTTPSSSASTSRT